jgi:FtsH-binding integral membrane protein
LVAVVASVVSGIVFWRTRGSHAHTVSQLVLSGVVCVFFSLYISFDVEYYSRVCTGPRCCRMGVLSVWSDWANVLLRLLRLYNELSQ